MKNVIFILLFFQTVCFTQSNNIQWGPLEKQYGNLQAILPGDGANFFTLTNSGGRFINSYYISEYEQSMKFQSSKVKIVAEQGIANLEKVLTVNKRPLVFLSDKINGQLCIYYKELTEDLKDIGLVTEITCYKNIQNKYLSRPNFDVFQSTNGRFTLISWEIPGKKESRDVYGFSILDSNLTVFNSGVYEIPFDGNMATIQEHHISNSGDYFMSVIEHLKPNDRLFSRNFNNYKATHIYQINKDSLDEFSIDLEGNRLNSISMKSTDSVFTLTGLYASRLSNRGISGVFYTRIDFKSKSIINKGFIPFSDSRINRNWSVGRERYIKRTRGANQPELYNYNLRNMELLSDGSIVGSMEQYYVYSRTNYDTRSGSSNTINYYYYDDIVAFKIGKENKFDWLTIIPKSQSSINDGGPYSSYANYVDGNNLCLIFNDNIKNYNEFGEFQTDRGIRSFSLSPRRNAVAMVKIDLKTGDANRSTLFKQKEIRSIAVPKLFYVNREAKEMILYAITRWKGRFGLIQYGE